MEFVSFHGKRVAVGYSVQKEQPGTGTEARRHTVKDTWNSLKGCRQENDLILFLLQKDL